MTTAFGNHRNDKAASVVGEIVIGGGVDRLEMAPARLISPFHTTHKPALPQRLWQWFSWRGGQSSVLE